MRDRGQAFTLESVAAATVLFIALVISLQSTVITPTTGGEADDESRNILRQEAGDTLRLMINNGTQDLSWYVRYWNPTNQRFYGATSPENGYGTAGPPGDFGDILEQRFGESGYNYNIVFRYRENGTTGDSDSLRLVYQGRPSTDAVQATRLVTLYDRQTLSSPGTPTTKLEEYNTNASSDLYYPIPNAVDGPIYNVVEVRLIVW